MRIETFRYDADRLGIVRWARWAGVGLLFYAAGQALDNFDLYTGQDGGFWVLLWVMLPWLGLATVLLFSHEALTPSASVMPLLAAGVVALASLALALRVLLGGEALMGPVIGEGGWSAVRVLTILGVPLAVLTVLLASNREGIWRFMPYSAIAVGVAVAAGSWALAVREIPDSSLAGTWGKIGSFVPSNSFAFLLIVGGVARISRRLGRQAAIAMVGLLLLDAAAMLADWSTRDLRMSGWLLATNLVIRASHMVLIAAFGGLLGTRNGFTLATACLLAVAIAAVGVGWQLESEVANWYWAVSYGVVSVVSVLLLSLVAIEVREQREPTSPLAPLLLEERRSP